MPIITRSHSVDPARAVRSRSSSLPTDAVRPAGLNETNNPPVEEHTVEQTVTTVTTSPEEDRINSLREHLSRMEEENARARAEMLQATAALQAERQALERDRQRQHTHFSPSPIPGPTSASVPAPAPLHRLPALQGVTAREAKLLETIADLQAENRDLKNRRATPASTPESRPAPDNRPADTVETTGRITNLPGLVSTTFDPRIKTENLPKFSGDPPDDVDDFIRKLTTLLDYCNEEALLWHIPFLLKGSAATWFAGMKPKERHRLINWEAWKTALRSQYYEANHEANMRRRSRYRVLRKGETFAQYFDAKLALLQYIYPEDTSDAELIADIMQGLPEEFVPHLTIASTGDTTLTEFRRILVNLEPGLRRQMPNVTHQRQSRDDQQAYSNYQARNSPNPRGSSDNRPSGDRPGNDRSKGDNKLVADPQARQRRPPPYPCRNCGANHWMVDCPKKPEQAKQDTAPKKSYSIKTSDVKSGAKRTGPASGVNAIPITYSRWPHPIESNQTNLNPSHNNVTGPPTGKSPLFLKPSSLASLHKAVTPVYATIALNHGTTQHSCCIDTGSGISLMDAGYHRKHLNNIKIQPHPLFQIQGIGRSLCTGWIEIEVTFTSTARQITLPIAFYIVPTLDAHILIGTDFLHSSSAVIDVGRNVMKLGDHAGDINIHCKQDGLKDYQVRTTEAYVISPGHIARIPVTFGRKPTTELAYFEPSHIHREYLRVARSVHRTDNPTQCVQVMNTGRTPLSLQKGQSLGILQPLQGPPPVVHANVAQQDSQALEEALALIDVNPDLSADQQQRLQTLFREYPGAFAHGNHRLGNTDLVTMDIITGDAKPIHYPPYHASPHDRKVIEENIAQLLADDVIEESDSPWASPAILVKQKGKDRFCIDYRKLNEVTKADQYPIPRIDDILAQFSGKTFFTSFDANKGFNQIQITPIDREKTAFRTHQGLHQYKRMPFGLKNGPSVFQRFMDKVLGRYKWQSVLVYIDDIIIYSSDFDTHCKDIANVLSLTEKSGLTLSPGKSHVAYSSIKALGHMVSNLGIGTTEETVRAVVEYPTPTMPRHIQQFLGLAAYYRRFIKNFAAIAAPLHARLKKDTPWEWTPECDAAFLQIKEKLTTAPILAHPNYEKEFIVYTDASTVGIGAVLSQMGEDGKEHPIVYLSRTLTPAEKNYGATELECLAIVWTVRRLHTYLDGSTFTIVTDHSALQWILDYNGSNKRMIRWTMDLQPYRDNMQIRYRPGRVNHNADPLSRSPVDELSTDKAPICLTAIAATSIGDTNLISLIRKDLLDDPECAKIITSLSSGEPLAQYKTFSLHDGLLYQQVPGENTNIRLYVPGGKSQLRILNDLHDSPSSGHLGTAKTLNLIGRQYYWPHMARDVKQYVRSCDSCQRNKSDVTTQRGLLQPLPIPPARWHTVAMDFAGPFQPSGEGQWDQILVVTDKLTKRSHFIPCKTTDSAVDTARRFWKEIVRLHGLPKIIVSDRDPKFTSLFWTNLFDQFGTKLSMSTAYHPQTDGQSERMVRTLKEMLRHYISHSQTDWVDRLPTLEFSYNNSLHASTNLTPFEVDLGWHPATPHTVLRPDARNVAAVEDFQQEMEALQLTAQDAILRAQQSQAHHYNQGRTTSPYKVGDQVLLSTKYVHPPFLRGPGSNKLREKFIGPFLITGQTSANSYELDLPAHIKVHPIINIQYLKPYHATPERFSSRSQEPTPPIIDPDTLEEEYVVEDVIGHRLNKGAYEYLVLWQGYPRHDATYEPADHLKAQTIRAYWKSRRNSSPANRAGPLQTRPTTSIPSTPTPRQPAKRRPKHRLDTTPLPTLTHSSTRTDTPLRYNLRHNKHVIAEPTSYYGRTRR